MPIATNMKTGPVSIRPFADDDLVAAAGLMTELGYPATVEQAGARIARYTERDDHLVLIAETGGRVVGLAGAEVGPSLEHDTVVGRITAMVVADGVRGLGVGAKLVAGIEDWARGHGVKRMTVTSHLRRKGAHVFYARVGYEDTGKRFVKEI